MYEKPLLFVCSTTLFVRELIFEILQKFELWDKLIYTKVIYIFGDFDCNIVSSDIVDDASILSINFPRQVDNDTI